MRIMTRRYFYLVFSISGKKDGANVLGYPTTIWETDGEYVNLKRARECMKEKINADGIELTSELALLNIVDLSEQDKNDFLEGLTPK